MITLLPLASFLAAASPEPARERLSLDADWRFHLGDIPMPEIKGHGMTYDNAKAGRAWGAAAADFDDSAWRKINAPHDWVVEGPFDKNANISQGYRPRGVAWYRRHIRFDESDRGKHLELQFDGVATHATVWVNGLLVHRNFCGYTSFQIDLTPIATYGNQLTTIVVRVDATPQEGWWYEGGGLYRHTWLVKRQPVHIETYGVFANPVRDSSGKWSVPVEITLNNIETAPADTEIEAELLDPEGRPVIKNKTRLTVPVLTPATAAVPLTVSGTPRLWSLESPTLYTVDNASEPGVITPAPDQYWPNTQNIMNAVQIAYTCGYGLGAAVPPGIKAWILMRIGALYENREEVVVGSRIVSIELPFVDRLLDPYQIAGF